MATLALAQALYLCAVSVDLTVTSLAGYTLAPNAALATVPMAAIALGSVAVASSAPRLMARWGARRVFLIGASASLAGGSLSALGVLTREFPLLCGGGLLVGVYQAAAGYYRYCGADISPSDRRAAGLTLVLSGGVAAAVAGPYLAAWASHAGPRPYVGSYLLVALLAVAALAVVATLRLPAGVGARGEADGSTGPAARPLPVIFRQPTFRAGATSAFAGYFCMAVLMAGAPIAMSRLAGTGGLAGMSGMSGPGHSAAGAATAVVIQLHMVGMYAPMLVVAPLLRRHGTWRVLAAGTGVFLAAGLVGMSGGSQRHFAVALLLAGVGWSLMYATGSVLLLSSYTASERGRPRGYGELAPVGGMLIGSLASAPIVTGLGWTTVCGLCLLILLGSLAVALASRAALTPTAPGG